MMELREDPAVVLVYLVRQMAQARDELVVPQTEVDARRILYGAPADDHGGGPAPGDVLVQILAGAVLGGTVLIPSPGGLPCLYNSVFKHAGRAERYGRKQLGIFHDGSEMLAGNLPQGGTG